MTLKKNYSLLLLLVTAFLFQAPIAMAKVWKENPSPIIPISNRPWLERTEKQDVFEGVYSQAPQGFNEEEFNSFFDLNNNRDVIYGFTFSTRREFPDEPRYYLYAPNINFKDTPLGDVSAFYLQYQRAEVRKAYLLGLQFAKKLLSNDKTEFKFVFRPIYVNSEGNREDDTVISVKQFLALLAADLKYNRLRGSLFTSFSNFPKQEEPVDIQTELIDLTHINGLQNISALARYMLGAHIGYRREKWGINATYAQIWTSRGSFTGTVYPTIFYGLNKYLSIRGAFQRVIGSDIFGSRNYGLISIAMGHED